MTNVTKAALSAILLIGATASQAADLTSNGGFAALGADRVARGVGDSITIVIYENATATNAADSGSKKSSEIGGGIRAGSTLDETGSLSFGGSSNSKGSTARSGHMVAQISAVVDGVLPNGDLRLSGEQMLNINGERTLIRIKGRVRPADISSTNAVLSNRLADATIDYDGHGFVSRSARPGVVSRIFNWLGLL